jgi:hypothetical protein
MMQVLRSTLRKLPSAEKMATQDTKFAEFVRVLRVRLRDKPDEKFVVFSTFRGTLSYLRERLDAEGIVSIMLHGDTQDRTEVVNDFRIKPSISVLLASEVGSEGIDLQFARTVVNYDLPWNPMRVEQRIGRVDRLGQEAPSISVLNLMYADTVDERIYYRLHERLKLCHQALGGFEEILGREITKLTKDLLSGKLSDEDKMRRLEQTEQAIAFRRQEEEALERDAAALFAHGDYVVNSIKASRTEGNWVTEKDIVDYVDSALSFLFSGSKVQWQVPDGLVHIRLSEAARYSFLEWCEKRKLSSAPIGHAMGAATFKVGKNSKPIVRHARLGPTHPLIRFLSERLEDRDGFSPLAISLRVESQGMRGLAPGVYVGCIEEWEFGKGVTSTFIGNALVHFETRIPVSDDIADHLITNCLAQASHWPTVAEEVDLEEAADCVESLLEPLLAERFFLESERREVELSDRVSMQLASLEVHAQRQRKNFEKTIFSAGKKLEAANKARLNRFEEGVKMRKLRIESQAANDPSSRQIAAYLLKVDP